MLWACLWSFFFFLLMSPNCSSGREHPGKTPHPWCYLFYFFFSDFPSTASKARITSPKAQQQFGDYKVILRRLCNHLTGGVVALCIQRRIWIKSNRDPSVKGDLELSEWRHSKSALKAIPGMFVDIRCMATRDRVNSVVPAGATIWPNCLTLIQTSNTRPAGPVCPFLE